MEEPSVEVTRSQSSVELSRGSKGGWAVKVKAYADTLEEASRLAQHHADDLSARYAPEGKG